MRCPRCQQDNPVGQKFCGECGAHLAATCSACGAPNPSTQKFCGECGKPLTRGAARFTSLESYTPKHLAERILTSKAALEGERKQVTVLFADLKGSMELLADRDPEEARGLLDAVLERMIEGVHHYEGTVNQVMGDGIMALFGAPLAHEDHAVRACYAALRMQELLKRYASDVRGTHGVNPQIRVGLNSGEVVVRAISSDLRMDYTAVGQTTHLAARMEQLADPGTVLLTAATLALSEDFVHVRPLGPTSVKGLGTPVKVYELVGATAVRSRFQAHAAHGLTTFVGRGSEMAQLAEALEQTKAGRGQVVTLVGEAGVGKSRLFWELGRSHLTAGCRLLESASVSYGRATAYLPLIELLRRYFEIETRDDERWIREKVIGKLLSTDRTADIAVLPLLSILGVPIEDKEWTALDPAQRRQRMLEAVKVLLIHESQVQPLILLFEDLHWIDSETQAVLDGLVESLPTARVLLLVSYRPEYSHAWGGKTYYHQLGIEALTPASAAELLQTLLGRDPGLRPLERLLIERTEGNPFFLEENVRTLVETGVLIGAPGAYRLTAAPESLQTPATVRAILAARIDRLESEDKALLQAAAVLGKDVSFLLLEAISDMQDNELRQRLARLQAAEFLYEVRLFPEIEYTFKHGLTHEVAYETLLNERRKALHARVVSAVESAYSDNLIEHNEILAHHAFQGGLWSEAALHLYRAGQQALYRGAFGDAGQRLAQSLVALEHLPHERQASEQSIDAHRGLSSVLFAQGKVEEGLSHLRSAESLARLLGDDGRLVRVLGHLAFMLLSSGELGTSLISASEALTRAQYLEDRELQAASSYTLGQIHHGQGDFQQARTALRRSIDLAALGRIERSTYYVDVTVAARAWLTLASADVGAFAEGKVVGDEAIAIAERGGSRWSMVTALACAGYLRLRQGAIEAAIEVLERSLRLCRESAIHVYFIPTGGALASAYALGGRVNDALDVLDQATTLARSLKTSHWHTFWLTLFAEGFASSGRNPEGREAAKNALHLARTQGARGYEAHGLRALADSLDLADAGEAEANYRGAIQLAGDLGMRPLVAHCHLGLGKLYLRVGKRQQAQEHVDFATDMYREMGMQFWLKTAARRR